MSALNSEMYFRADTADMRKAQFAWMDADLKKARANADWVIVYGHRPLYCSNLDTLSDCTVDAKRLRDGVNGELGIEDLIASHNVDLYIAGHEVNQGSSPMTHPTATLVPPLILSLTLLCAPVFLPLS